MNEQNLQRGRCPGRGRRARTPLAIGVMLCVLTAVASPLEARELAPGVDAYVAEVLARNPSLRAQLQAREAARREASAAGLWPDPSASVMLDRVPERMGGEMPMVRYQLSQMIPWPGKLGLMEAAAERRTDAARADADTVSLDITRDAKRGYWMLLMNQGLRGVNAAGRGLLDTIVNAALARYGAGSGGHHEVVRAEVERNAIDVEAIDLDGERVAVLAMLNALRNLPTETPMGDPIEPLPGGARDVVPLGALERVALARRPELGRMRAMRREQEAMAALARRERYPDVMTSVWYNQMLGGHDTTGLMLGVSLPVFGLARQARLAAGWDMRASGAGSELTAMQTMIRFEVADARRKLATAVRTDQLVRDVASPRAHQSFVASLAGYATGSVDIVGVLEAWRALQAIERARVEATAARLMAIADLERAIGASLAEVSP